MDQIIAMLTDKDDQAAYEYTKKIAAESEASDRYYACLPLFASLLGDPKSYIRTRAFILCCSQARWDSEGKLRELLPRMFALLHDQKPTVVRQSLNALQKVAAFRPELREMIRSEVMALDLSGYKDSMVPLIRKDIDSLCEVLGAYTGI